MLSWCALACFQLRMMGKYFQSIQAKVVSVMESDMSFMLPNLYVGAALDVADPVQLKKYAITRVVSIMENAEPLNKDCQFLCVNVKDDEREDISKHISQVNDFVHEGRSKGAVLIHCAVGISRSVAFTIAYIMTITGLPFDQVLKIVQHRRPIACPNEGFRQQLQKFGEAENLSREVNRFRIKFNKDSDRFDDIQECKTVLNQLEKKNSLFGRNKSP